MDFWEIVSDFARDFFGKMGKLIVTCGGGFDAMVCVVVNLAP
jgi:hypothetical protein